MLRIHTGSQNWSKRNIFDLHLNNNNLFDFRVPCIKIAKSELLFGQYIMALNRGKYDIEVQNDDAIKRNRILFDFVKLTFNRLDGLYILEICLLIDVIMKYQLRKQGAAEIEKLSREKKSGNKIKEGTYKPSPKKACLLTKTTGTSKATSNLSN